MMPEIPLWHFQRAQLQSKVVRSRTADGKMIAEAGNHPPSSRGARLNESATATPAHCPIFARCIIIRNSIPTFRELSTTTCRSLRAEDSAANDADSS